MYPVLHRILLILYAGLPPAALMWTIAWGRHKKTFAPFASFLVTCLSGIILGTCVDVIFVALLHGSLSPMEVVRTWYFIIGLLCTVGLFRWIVRVVTLQLFRVQPTLAKSLWVRVRWSFASTLQLVLLFGLGLPYVIGTLLVHRIGISRPETPQSVAQCDAERVSFPSTDGLNISAWWIPADPQRSATSGRGHHASGADTVLLSGGLADDLSDEAGLLRVLVNDGYNVLAVNLRGHEGSEGRWTSFGDLERRDLLGAVRWLRANHTDESEGIKALGIGIGGAASIAAATDPSDEGQSINAVAVFGTYAHFQSLADQLFTAHLPLPIRHLAMAITLPIASAHAGTDLANFSPANLVSQLWPRPLLIVEGRGDRIFPPGEADELFRQATYPKRAVWLQAGHSDALHNGQAARELLDFFDNVHPQSAI